MKGPIVAVAAIAFLFLSTLGASVVIGEMKSVSNTSHDVAPPDVSPCVYCHLPRDPDGDLLWANNPNSGDDFSGLEPLCFSCHDGTVTSVGSYVFDGARPDHLSNPGLRNQDCDRCHDPHDEGYGKFIKLPNAANFCNNCHSRAGSTDHPIDVDVRASNIQPIDVHWNPEEDDFSGTRLWNIEGTGPGDYMKCLTCHSPHGSEAGTDINTLAFDSTHDAFLSICQNCHYGWGSE